MPAPHRWCGKAPELRSSSKVPPHPMQAQGLHRMAACLPPHKGEPSAAISAVGSKLLSGCSKVAPLIGRRPCPLDSGQDQRPFYPPFLRQPGAKRRRGAKNADAQKGQPLAKGYHGGSRVWLGSHKWLPLTHRDLLTQPSARNSPAPFDMPRL